MCLLSLSFYSLSTWPIWQSFLISFLIFHRISCLFIVGICLSSNSCPINRLNWIRGVFVMIISNNLLVNLLSSPINFLLSFDEFYLFTLLTYLQLWFTFVFLNRSCLFMPHNPVLVFLSCFQTFVFIQIQIISIISSISHHIFPVIPHTIVKSLDLIWCLVLTNWLGRWHCHWTYWSCSSLIRISSKRYCSKCLSLDRCLIDYCLSCSWISCFFLPFFTFVVRISSCNPDQLDGHMFFLVWSYVCSKLLRLCPDRAPSYQEVVLLAPPGQGKAALHLKESACPMFR